MNRSWWHRYACSFGITSMFFLCTATDLRKWCNGPAGCLPFSSPYIQLVPRHAIPFHRYKYLMQFMCDNVPEAAEEIRMVYIESMGRTISALFRAYHSQLMKLELEMASRHDLIAVEVGARIFPRVRSTGDSCSKCSLVNRDT